MKKYIKPELLVTDFNLNDILRTSTQPASLMNTLDGDGSTYRNLGSAAYNEIFGSDS